MLIPARVGLALRCPACHQVALHHLALFACGRGPVRLACPCGGPPATLRQARRRVELHLPCPLCGGWHRLVRPAGRFWAGAAWPLRCPATGLQVGLAGDPIVAAAVAARPEDGVALQGAATRGAPGAPGFFVNPDVMYEVLSAVCELERAGRLRCRCGSTAVDYDLQPDRLDLWCTVCGAHRSLPAATDGDAERVRRAGRLELGGRAR